MNRKVALLVGGSGGIGSEIARSLVEKNIHVCCTYYKNKENGEKLLKELGKKSISLYQMNLYEDKSINSALENVFSDYNNIDVVIFSVTTPVKNINIFQVLWEDFEEHIYLQTKGLYKVVQKFKEQIRGKYKTKFIIILTEYCIGKPPKGLSHYITAKYSLMGFAKSIAVEFANYNCTVNMVSPGMVRTNLISNLPPKLIEITTENNPLKRIANPKDVANVVLFLSSDDSDYINGVNITVNGGGVML